MTFSPISLDELASDPLVHRHGDLFAAPGLTNFLGTVQVDNDLVAVRNLTFPPFAQGETITARAYLDGRLIGSYGADVTFQWRADRVVRSADLGGFSVNTTTVLVPDTMACVVEVHVRALDGRTGAVPFHVGFAGNVTKALRPWNAASAPGELGNNVTPDAGRNALVFEAVSSSAVLVQGVDQPATISERGVDVELALDSDGTARVAIVLAVGETAATALETYDAVVARVRDVPAQAEQRWQAELDAMFTVGNDRFGGSLPVLETDNAALRRLYYMGALGTLYFRRDSPYSVIGRAYDTLMPRYWASVTFIWDYYLAGRMHALLDPGVMRRHLEHWIATDTHTHFGTNWLTGDTIGYWYSVNDLAMTRMVTDYVKWTGDEGWLDQPVEGEATGRTVAEHVDVFATAWQALRQEHGLADYGGIDNLLECVSSYVHAVAGLNAANVWCLRVAADLHEHRGDLDRAEQLRSEAKALAAAVNELYVDGGGFWRTRHPDGTEVEVRHCYDFFQVPFGMVGDLSEQQKQEIAAFFQRELMTPAWMHALSPWDADAIFSVRPDHQWNGAYPAWPAESARALLQLGRDDIVAPWLEGLAASTNQGPLGQAHFAEDAVPPDGRGARKAPPEFPWITDWTCSSSGAWVGLVIDAVFGVDVAFDGTVTAKPMLARIDPNARLRNLVVRGVVYEVDADGVHS